MHPFINVLKYYYYWNCINDVCNEKDFYVVWLVARKQF